MNIIRVKLPEGVIRLKPFTVKDYLDFLLIRKEIEESPDSAKVILDELLEELYPEYDKNYRAYIFITVFAISIGKNILPVRYKCKQCGKTKKYPFNLALKEIKPAVLETAGIKITFKFTTSVTTDVYELFENCVDTVSDGNNTYKWTELTQDLKDQILAVITIEDFDKIMKEIYPIYIELDLSCCNTHKVIYTDFVDIYRLIVSDEELIMMYKINHLMTSHNYSISEVLSMTPMERTITLALIEADIKAKSGK